MEKTPWEAGICLSLMEPEDSLPCSQELITGPCLGPHSHTLFLLSYHLCLSLQIGLFPFMHFSSHPWYDHHNNIKWRVQIMNVHIFWFSPFPYYFLSLRSLYFPQHPVHQHPQYVSFPYSVMFGVYLMEYKILLISVCAVNSLDNRFMSAQFPYNSLWFSCFDGNSLHFLADYGILWWTTMGCGRRHISCRLCLGEFYCVQTNQL
jgi:hypothetical protein